MTSIPNRRPAPAPESASKPSKPSQALDLAARARALLGAESSQPANDPPAAPAPSRPTPRIPSDRTAPVPNIRPGLRPWTDQRPKTRADCIDRPRPCPWVSCRYHLLLDQTPGGTLTINRAGTPPGADRAIRPRRRSLPVEATWQDTALDALDHLPETCALDVAARGGLSLHAAAARRRRETGGRPEEGRQLPREQPAAVVCGAVSRGLSCRRLRSSSDSTKSL
jgi:hypothetical protein